MLLAATLAGWLGPVEKLFTYHPSILIIAGVIGSYIVGQATYISRIILIKGLYRLLGNPHTYLIGSVKKGNRIRRSKLFKLLLSSDFEKTFKSALVAKLDSYWGKRLVRRAPLGVYMLCARFVRKHSPANAYYLDRSVSLRNMHGALVLPTVFLTVVLFVRVHNILLGIFCLIAVIVFLRGCYANIIEEAKIVYRTFYMLQHETVSQEK